MSGLQLQPKTGVDTDATYVEADEAEWLMNADIVDSLVADWNQDLSHGCYTYKTHGPQPDTDAHWKMSMIDIASMYHLSNPHDQLHETDHARGWCTCRMSRSNINNPKLYKNPRCRSYWRWLIINLSVRFFRCVRSELSLYVQADKARSCILEYSWITTLCMHLVTVSLDSLRVLSTRPSTRKCIVQRCKPKDVVTVIVYSINSVFGHSGTVLLCIRWATTLLLSLSQHSFQSLEYIA